MSKSAEEIGEPLSDDGVRALGYEPTPSGWRPTGRGGKTQDATEDARAPSVPEAAAPVPPAARLERIRRPPADAKVRRVQEINPVRGV